ncbi:MAG: PhoH family protein [Desulfovibrio sp.]|nr:PhoH family protein [Desulfovibrio sp.]
MAPSPMTPPERTGARTAFAFAARGEDSPKTSRTSGSASVQTSSPAPQGLRTTSDRAASPSPTETLLQKKERFLREKAALLSTHETSGAKPSLFLSLQTPKKLITARNAAQQRYIELLQSHDIVFALGPAGTGKTYLAVAYAVHLLSARSITKLILTRPAVEAGEKLGFLPGDLIEKINPYLRPLYDALYDMLPQAKVAALCETGSIEIAPLAFMRGRTLHDACIILDEAQNTTREQMKMFLTRMGFGSKIIVTGDTSQIDLPSGAKGEQPLSGLVHATRILERVNGIALHSFSKSDVVRHPLVGEIVNAYDIAENRRTQA